MGSVVCAGHLMESKLKQLLPALPVVYIRAVPVEPQWEPTSVGFVRHDPKVYDCPLYTTTFRGPTYVFLATLRTKDPVHKWVLAGVAIIMQVCARARASGCAASAAAHHADSFRLSRRRMIERQRVCACVCVCACACVCVVLCACVCVCVLGDSMCDCGGWFLSAGGRTGLR